LHLQAVRSRSALGAWFPDGLHENSWCLIMDHHLSDKIGGSYAPLVSGAREAPPKRARHGPAQLIWV
jgi:hypothetical protein